MIEDMLLGGGLFIVGTLFGYVCSKNDSEIGLMMENAILKHELDKCRCKEYDD